MPAASNNREKPLEHPVELNCDMYVEKLFELDRRKQRGVLVERIDCFKTAQIEHNVANVLNQQLNGVIQHGLWKSRRYIRKQTDRLEHVPRKFVFSKITRDFVYPPRTRTKVNATQLDTNRRRCIHCVLFVLFSKNYRNNPTSIERARMSSLHTACSASAIVFADRLTR